MAAVALFDSFQPLVRLQTEEEARNLLIEWLMIAARDGAMSIYHFGKVWQAIPALVKKCPVVDALVDPQDLRAVGRAFETGFPHWAAVRKGVAHSGDFAKDRANTDQHGITGEIDLPGIKGENLRGTYFSGSLLRRNFTASVDGKMVSYEVSGATVAKLADVRDAVWAIFEKVKLGLMSPAEREMFGNVRRP